jgi:hypothetical protein
MGSTIHFQQFALIGEGDGVGAVVGAHPNDDRIDVVPRGRRRYAQQFCQFFIGVPIRQIGQHLKLPCCKQFQPQFYSYKS